VDQLIDAVAQRERSAGDECAARRYQCPEVGFSPVSQGMPDGGRAGAAPLSDEQEHVVGGIGK
jgi:hypothetical protein